MINTRRISSRWLTTRKACVSVFQMNGVSARPLSASVQNMARGSYFDALCRALLHFDQRVGHRVEGFIQTQHPAEHERIHQQPAAEAVHEFGRRRRGQRSEQ